MVRPRGGEPGTSCRGEERRRRMGVPLRRRTSPKGRGCEDRQRGHGPDGAASRRLRGVRHCKVQGRGLEWFTRKSTSTNGARKGRSAEARRRIVSRVVRVALYLCHEMTNRSTLLRPDDRSRRGYPRSQRSARAFTGLPAVQSRLTFRRMQLQRSDCNKSMLLLLICGRSCV